MQTALRNGIFGALILSAGAGGGLFIGSGQADANSPAECVATASPSPVRAVIAGQFQSGKIGADSSAAITRFLAELDTKKPIDSVTQFLCSFESGSEVCKLTIDEKTSVSVKLSEAQLASCAKLASGIFGESGMLTATQMGCTVNSVGDACKIVGSRVVDADKIPPGSTLIDYLRIKPKAEVVAGG